MGADALGAVHVHGPDLESGAFQISERPFHAGQRFVGLHGPVGIEGIGIEAGAHDVDAVEPGLGSDFLRIALELRIPSESSHLFYLKVATRSNGK